MNHKKGNKAMCWKREGMTRWPRRAMQLIGVLVLTFASASAGYAAPVTQSGSTADLYYAPRQVIVTGCASDTALVMSAALPAARLEDSINLGDFQQRPGRDPDPFRNCHDLVIELYELPPQLSVPVAVRKINTTAQSVALNVVAHPDYVMGLSPKPLETDPWTGAGDPVLCSSKGEDPVPCAPQEAQARFTEQWAFGPQGINLYTDNGGQLARTVKETGAGVCVGVFDTSPLPAGNHTIEALPGMALTVVYPEAGADLPLPEKIDVSDHGLFAAGLIYAVAPDSSITLIGALDKYGQGDVFELNAAIAAYVSQTLKLAACEHTVINLSLGLHLPSEELGLAIEEVASLKAMVDVATEAGAVVVAAAGNDSGGEEAAARPHFPAAYAEAISVAGSTFTGERSCFSNKGMIAAPAGDGTAACAIDMDKAAQQPERFLVGLALSSESDFAYWSGTSFATPLVAGTAALILEQADGSLTPQEVAERMYTTATAPNLPLEDHSLGAGIVSVPAALLVQKP